MGFVMVLFSLCIIVALLVIIIVVMDIRRDIYELTGIINDHIDTSL